jgi:hypothetical protein
LLGDIISRQSYIEDRPIGLLHDLPRIPARHWMKRRHVSMYDPSINARTVSRDAVNVHGTAALRLNDARDVIQWRTEHRGGHVIKENVDLSRGRPLKGGPPWSGRFIRDERGSVHWPEEE